jgi:hypothetical protein
MIIVAHAADLRKPICRLAESTAPIRRLAFPDAVPETTKQIWADPAKIHTALRPFGLPAIAEFRFEECERIDLLGWLPISGSSPVPTVYFRWESSFGGSEQHEFHRQVTNAPNLPGQNVEVMQIAERQVCLEVFILELAGCFCVSLGVP